MNYKEEALKMIEEGRVVFPLRDIDGNITGVIGKLLFKKDPSVPTYVKRGKGFFGNFETQRNEIIITECLVDVLTAQSYKFDNVVTFSSIKPEDDFTDDVLKRISKLNKRIILFFDNDKFGKRNAEALHSKMEEYGMDVDCYLSEDTADLIDFLANRSAG